MIPHITRGSDPEGLVRYLFGKGRHNEHTGQHLVAGSDDMLDLFDTDGKPRCGFREISRSFDRNYRRLAEAGDPCPPDRRGRRNPEGCEGMDRVWHCSLSIGSRDGRLSEQEWQDIATEFLHRMGITDAAGGGATWMAVHHGLSRNGNDHIHLAVQLAGEHEWHNPFRDRRRAQKARASMERQRPELRETSGQGESVEFHWALWRRWAEWKAESEWDGDTPWKELPAKRRRAVINRTVTADMPRTVVGRLVRACATAARSEDEFVRRIRREGLIIEPRLAKGVHKDGFTKAGQVVGYSITWKSADGWTERFPATVLGRDMTLRQLRRKWAGDPKSDRLAAEEWRASLEHRPPVMASGWERKPGSLTTHDMATLVDQAFGVLTDIADATPEERDRRMRDGLKAFSRLRENYGLDALPDFGAPFGTKIDMHPGGRTL